MRRRWFVDWTLSTDPRPFMVVLGAWNVIWGTWLIIPWSDAFNNSIYGAMVFLAPESVWGALLIAAGSGQIFHAFRRKIGWAATLTSMLSCFLWGFIFAAFLISAPYSTAIPVYSQVVVWNAWLLYRVNGERRYGPTDYN